MAAFGVTSAAARVTTTTTAQTPPKAAETPTACRAGIDCGVAGLASIPGDPGPSCAAPDALREAKRTKEAETAYVKLLAAHPRLACASSGLAQIDTANSDKLGDAEKNTTSLAKTLVAIVGSIVAIVLLAAVLALVVLQGLTRWNWSKGIWPARLVRRVRLEVKSFGDAALATRQGPTVAALIRARMTRRRDMDLDLATGQKGLTEALKPLADASPEAKAALSVANALLVALPRRRFVISGELHPAGGGGSGISLALARNGRGVAATSFWGRDIKVAELDTPNVFQRLTVPGAAWLDHQLASQLGDDPGDLLTGDPRSWALFRSGLTFHQEGDAVRASSLYATALEIDPDNIGALGNLGLIELKAGDYDEAERLMQRAIELLEQ